MNTSMCMWDTFKKNGGMKLLRQYCKSGVLFTAIGQFFLLGKSRTALEILRLSAQLKTKQKLYRRYRYVIAGFDEEWKTNDYDNTLKHELSDKIWICWFQGMDNAPEIVKKCYESIKRNLPAKEIILLTEDNISDYVQFPEYVIEKRKKGYISDAHMSDLLRLELLIKYGGMWLDATVYCTDKPDDYFFNSDLFFYQCLKPGRDGHPIYISSWLISAKTNNRILMATRAMCYEYWKRNNEMVDYYLLHMFLSIVLDYYPKEWKKIPPRDNAAPHILLLRLFDEYDEKIWDAVKAQTPFHKLSYKVDGNFVVHKNSYYEKIMVS